MATAGTAPKKKAKKAAPVGTEFAIIAAGGKQYKVMAGEVLSLEKINGYNAGDTIIFDKVLLVENLDGTTIGDPYIKGAQVTAECIEHGKRQKVMVVKYKAKARYHKQNGHRQPYTKVKIAAIK